MSGSGHFSSDAWVLVRPAAAFRALAAQPAAGGRWIAWRRPLFFAFVLGSMVSLTTVGSLTARLVLSSAIMWAFIPAIEIAALALVLRGAGERRQLPRLIDLFCTGFGVWSLWMLGLSIIFAAVPPKLMLPVFSMWLDVGAAVAVLWSAYIDYCFFREVLGRTPVRARRALLVHRLLSWVPFLLIFDYPAIVPTILYFAGR